MNRLSDELLYKTIRDYFVVYLPKMRNCSDNTIRSYKKTLLSLLEYLSKKNNVSLSELKFQMINADSVGGFILSLKTSGASITTCNQRLHAIRSFLSYAAMSDPSLIIYKNDINRIPLQKVPPQPIIEYLSENAIKALFEQPDKNTEKGLRDLFLLLLMYDSAARVQEIADVRIGDLNIDNTTSTLILHGKGSKTRIVPLMQSTVKYCRIYCSIFHSNGEETINDYLFYSIRHGKKDQLDTSTIRKMIQKYGEMARENCPAVPEKVHPHLLRHSRAMHLYQHGMDLTLISQWLGHAQLETTIQYYAYADTEQKRKAIEQATPKNSILNQNISVKKFVVSDDDMIKRLYGLI